MYPQTWVRIGASADRLQVLSSSGGAKGVIIKQGQAEITVMEVKGSSTDTLAQVVEKYTQGTSVLERRDVHSETSNDRCTNLREVISKEPSVPPKDTPIQVPYTINTDLFCEIGKQRVVVLLRNWEGDERQAEYQQIALRMAESIKLR